MKIPARAVLFLLVIFLLIICKSSSLQAQKVKILYVPLDERPVNLNYVIRTFEGLQQVELLVPPKEYLPRKNVPANVDAIWNWVFDNSSQADYIVLSADTLIYGSLTASRLHHLTQNTIDFRLSNFDKLRSIASSSKIYVFSTVMRTPRMGGSTAEPGYYKIFGNEIFKITALYNKKQLEGLSVEEKQQLKGLLKKVPDVIFHDWISRRNKNFDVNMSLIEKTKENVIDYFVLCRDDTAKYSQSSIELKALLESAGCLSDDQFVTFSGADEVGLVLLTRAFNEWKNESPSVYVYFFDNSAAKEIALYEDQTLSDNVNAHIIAAGCIRAENIDDADLVLIVNTHLPSKNSLNVEDFKVNIIEDYLNKGYKIAVADVAFPNGADNDLMFALARENLLDDLTAYAGWNTAGNTIGYAICQAVLAKDMPELHMQKMILERFLDDWAYQANVRSKINEFVESMGINRNALPEDKIDVVKEKTKNELLKFANRHMKCFCIKDIEIDFPFDRTFEVDIEVVR